jgi:phosphatidylglycerol:prolipoprotein diacylglycerol transferase
MYPVLFRIGGFRVETYYVLWTLALSLFVLWSRRRAVGRFGMDYDEATSVLLWLFLGTLVGARLGSYVDHWGFYAEHPERLIRFWEGGLSAGPAFLGGGLAGWWRLRRLHLPADPLFESLAVPSAFLIFVGRFGCLGEGCCVGIETRGPLGFHFPFDPAGVFRYPTQLFEALAGAAIGCLLLLLERRLDRLLPGSRRPAIALPLFLILYGSYRFFMDFLRSGERVFPLFLVQYLACVAIGLGAIWLVRSLCLLRARRDEYVVL